MKRIFTFFAMALLAAGCGGSGKPEAESSGQATGKPGADEAKACIAGYLGQCGWQNVELVTLADCDNLPPEAKTGGELWAFTFTARYTNIVGERQTSENWIAVVARSDGKACVRSCFDNARRLVGGHRGDETSEIANLNATGPVSELPAIIPPKP
jgi:hypothetical protein